MAGDSGDGVFMADQEVHRRDGEKEVVLERHADALTTGGGELSRLPLFFRDQSSACVITLPGDSGRVFSKRIATGIGIRDVGAGNLKGLHDGCCLVAGGDLCDGRNRCELHAGV